MGVAAAFQRRTGVLVQLAPGGEARLAAAANAVASAAAKSRNGLSADERITAAVEGAPLDEFFVVKMLLAHDPTDDDAYTEWHSPEEVRNIVRDFG